MDNKTSNYLSPPLLTLKQHIDRLASQIHAPAYLLPTYNDSADYALPHIEHRDGIYHYVIVERGRELERISTDDIDEILYQIFQGVTFTMACDFEVRNRRHNEDSRRQMFAKQIELLEQLSTSWAQRRNREQKSILQAHPFHDSEDHRRKPY